MQFFIFDLGTQSSLPHRRPCPAHPLVAVTYEGKLLLPYSSHCLPAIPTHYASRSPISSVKGERRRDRGFPDNGYHGYGSKWTQTPLRAICAPPHLKGCLSVLLTCYQDLVLHRRSPTLSWTTGQLWGKSHASCRGRGGDEKGEIGSVDDKNEGIVVYREIPN